jgi:hypothetical protein
MRMTGCWRYSAWLPNTSSKKPGGGSTMSGLARSIRTNQTKRSRRDCAHRASRADNIADESTDERRTAISLGIGIGDGQSANAICPDPHSAVGNHGTLGNGSRADNERSGDRPGSFTNGQRNCQ